MNEEDTVQLMVALSDDYPGLCLVGFLEDDGRLRRCVHLDPRELRRLRESLTKAINELEGN